MNDTPHHEYLDIAFGQLSFAIKLWNYLDENPIEKEKFDIKLTIDNPKCKVCLPGGEFGTYSDIKIASENSISIAFGAAAITLWEAIQEYSLIKPNTLDPKRSYKENLASLSYMIRCCFAHGSAVKKWAMNNKKYKELYHVGSRTIDLSNIRKGQVFEYQSIAGCGTLWLLKDEAFKVGLI